MEKKRFIFDLDGTILKTDYSYEKAYFRRVLGEEKAKVFIPRIFELLTLYEKTFPKYDIYNLSRFLTMKSGINITPEIIRGWNETFKETDSYLVEHVVDVLEYLKEKEKSIVVLTNWFLDVQKERLDKCLLSGYFEGIYGGETYLKPFRESYYNACGNYSVGECVMIGDSLENDVLGPMIYGLDAIYYDSNGKNNYDKKKVKAIRCMKEIKEMY